MSSVKTRKNQTKNNKKSGCIHLSYIQNYISFDRIIAILNIIIATITIIYTIPQLNISLKSLEEQQSHNKEILESLRINEKNRFLIVDLEYNTSINKEIHIIDMQNKSEFKVNAPIINMNVIQGSVRKIQTIYVDDNSFGIDNLTKPTDIEKPIGIVMKNAYKTGETSNYYYVRNYLIINGRDLSRHIFMSVYQIDKKDNTVKNKVLWSELELIYLNSKYIFVDNVMYDPDEKIVVQERNTPQEEMILFVKYLKEELKIFNRVVENYKK